MSESNGNGNHASNHVGAVGALVIPGKNGGRLRNGGTNKGGPGRPTSALREKLRGSFKRRVKILEEIADGDAVQIVKDAQGHETDMRVSAPIADRLKALDLLAKYGLGTTITETDTEGNDVHIRVTREPRALFNADD